MSFPRILFAGPEFPAARALLADELPDADIGVLGDGVGHAAAEILVPLMANVDGTLMDSVSGLRLIHQWGAGLEGVDIDAASARRIAVGNVPSTVSGNAEAVAEWCVMALIALGRHLGELQRSIRTGGPWGAPMGRSLAGSTVGIVGLGGIGTALARRLVGFDVTVQAVTRRPDPRRDHELGLASQAGPAQLPHLLAESDAVCLCLPLSASTRHLIDARAFAQMKQGSVLVNAGRGGLVDEGALLASLRSGRLAGAALDVFSREPLATDSPLLQLPNVLATPHIAGVTSRSYRGNARRISEAAVALAAGRPLERCVNWAVIADRFYDDVC